MCVVVVGNICGGGGALPSRPSCDQREGKQALYSMCNTMMRVWLVVAT